jgi:MFS family permease
VAPPALDRRRPIYLYNSILPVFVIGSAGLVAAQNIRVPSLLPWRFLQSMGSSLGPSLGAAVIGDTFKLEEGGLRGFALPQVKLLFITFGCLDLISID